ncbi:MAG: MFS transporter [Acidobacteriota bacterium]
MIRPLFASDDLLEARVRADAESARSFHGRRILGVSFVTLFISVGFGFYSFGPFFKAIASELGGSRLGVGGALTTFMVATALMGPWLGRAVDGGSIRKIMTIGVLCLASGFFLISLVQNLLQFYVVLAVLIGLGAAMIGDLTASALVANWFVRRRGMALGIATMGISLSGVVMAPIATVLIESVGWRGTFRIYGMLALIVVFPVVRLLVVTRPEDVGLLPDNDPPPEPEPTAVEAAPVPSAPALQPSAPPTGTGVLRDRNFWVLAIVIALTFCPNSGTLTHIIPHVTDLGFSGGRAALVLSVIAFLGVLGKVLFGWVSDRIDKRLALFFAVVGQAIGVLVFRQTESYALILVGGAIFGLSMGGMVPLWGAAIGALFGRDRFGRVMGLMRPVMLPIQTIGVPLAGWLYDVQGNYQTAFGVFFGFYCASMLLMLALRIEDGGA